jgi:hypothetical protein
MKRYSPCWGLDGPTIQIWFDRVSLTCERRRKPNPNIADACIRLDPMLADPAYSRNRLTGCIIIQRFQISISALDD